MRKKIFNIKENYFLVTRMINFTGTAISFAKAMKVFTILEKQIAFVKKFFFLSDIN